MPHYNQTAARYLLYSITRLAGQRSEVAWNNIMDYKLGEHLSVNEKTGKLEIKSSKKRLIKLAEKEIKIWQKFIENLKGRIK